MDYCWKLQTTYQKIKIAGAFLKNLLKLYTQGKTSIQSIKWRPSHFVSRFTCNTMVIVDASSNTPVPVPNCCNRNLESNHQVNKQKLTSHHQSNVYSIR